MQLSARPEDILSMIKTAAVFEFYFQFDLCIVISMPFCVCLTNFVVIRRSVAESNRKSMAASSFLQFTVWPEVAVGDRFCSSNARRSHLDQLRALREIGRRQILVLPVYPETGSSFLASKWWPIDPYNLLKSNRNTWSTSRLPLCGKLTDTK